MIIVMKFGGTSLADAERIRNCAALVRSVEPRDRAVAVVSAMAGVTDNLLELAAAAAAGNRSATHMLLGNLRQRHEQAARTLGAQQTVGPLLDRLDTLVNGIAA